MTMLRGEQEAIDDVIRRCEQYGYGNMMHRISEAWRRECPSGAFRVGACFGSPDPEVELTNVSRRLIDERNARDAKRVWIARGSPELVAAIKARDAFEESPPDEDEKLLDATFDADRELGRMVRIRSQEES